MSVAQWLKGKFKSLERLGRKQLFKLLSRGLGVKQQPLALEDNLTILFIRLDERLGNLLLLTPVLTNLRYILKDLLGLADCQIDLLVHAANGPLFSQQPEVRQVLLFNKRRFWGREGFLALCLRLRKRAYTVIIDAANPTDPSLTQALLTRFLAAKYSIGVEIPGLSNLYTTPVKILESEFSNHEVALRLQLLKPFLRLVKGYTDSSDLLLTAELMNYPRVLQLGKPLPLVATSLTHIFLRELRETYSAYSVLNIGARLVHKRLSLALYQELAESLIKILPKDNLLVLTYGPREQELALALQALVPAAKLAPPTDLVELAHILQTAAAVLSCDTGPMHLAVALKTPTLGIFVEATPLRYAHAYLPHAVIDLRQAPAASTWIPAATNWLAARVNPGVAKIDDRVWL